jgi:hypothetical protein
MTMRRLLKQICPTASAACLVAGYALTGTWVALVPVGLVWLAWLFAASWLASFMLAASVALAAGGLWLGASPFLMIPAAALGLASWDLVGWDDFLPSGLSGAVEARLERKHYTCLALALGPSLLVALVGHLLQFPIPFGGLLALALLLFLGVDRIWSLVKK